MADYNGRAESLMALTTDIVIAHVGHHSVSADDLPVLISDVYKALSGLGMEGSAEKTLEPAVSIRSSLKSDQLTCLDCGKKMKMLKRHLSTEHDLTPEDYRRRWNLPADYPMVCPNYSEKRSELAKEAGLGQKPTQKRGRRKPSKG